MRSTVTIDSQLLNELKREMGSRSKTQAVLLAIYDYLRRHKMAKIRTLKGKIHFDKTADELRHYDR